MSDNIGINEHFNFRRPPRVKRLHFEIIVDIGGFKWMIQTTDEHFVDDKVGLYIEPDAIHIMKKSEYSGLYGDYSSFSEEFDELSDATVYEDDEE